jgi:superfamily II DNA or RNA helicase
VKKSTLVKKRIIHEVDCYVIPTNFRADWYVEKVEDKTVDHFVDRKTLLLEMQNDDERNELALRLTEECVRAGLPSLVFAQYVDHARKLDHALTKRGIASGLALGSKEWESTFKETLQQLRDGRLQVGCGTFGKLGVGHDIPTVAAGIAVTPVHQNKGFLGQVKGRICRTTAGKQNARILVLWDQHVFGIDPLLNLRAWNEVCNMWDEVEARWRPIAEYLKERKHDDGFRRLTSGQATSAGDIDDIFQSANRGRGR